jgi:hypothetical protein
MHESPEWKTGDFIFRLGRNCGKGAFHPAFGQGSIAMLIYLILAKK